jgi:hypothetical protein
LGFKVIRDGRDFKAFRESKVIRDGPGCRDFRDPKA